MVNTKIDLDYAYSYCKEIAISHYENFPVGSFLIPAKKRNFIYSVYAFARYADDIADSDKLSSGEKVSKLNELNNELNKIETGKENMLIPDTENVFIALSNTIREFKIPVMEFRNLLAAFIQDSVRQRYDSFDELIEYSGLSANPIGHLVLYIFDFSPEKDAMVFNDSDSICTALQLTNFWQDVSEDIKINRIYIPSETMKDFNYNEEMLFEKNENDDFRKMMKYLAGRTKLLFEDGKKITGKLKGRLKLELKGTIEGGLEILSKLEEINYNVLSRRVVINNFDKIKLFGKIILK